MSDKSLTVEITLKVIKCFDDLGNPTCNGCKLFRWNSIPLEDSSSIFHIPFCGLLSKNLEITKDFVGAIPRKECPIHYPKDSKVAT